MFRKACFINMKHHMVTAPGHSPHCTLIATHAAQLLQGPDWEQVVTLAAAWALQDNVAIELQPGTYMATFPTTHPMRLQWLGSPDDRLQVTVTHSSLAHPCNINDRSSGRQTPSWAVFTSMLRFPNVSGLVPLPGDIAAMCTSHPTTWPMSCSRDNVLCGLKVSRAPDIDGRDEPHCHCAAAQPRAWTAK